MFFSPSINRKDRAFSVQLHKNILFFPMLDHVPFCKSRLNWIIFIIKVEIIRKRKKEKKLFMYVPTKFLLIIIISSLVLYCLESYGLFSVHIHTNTKNTMQCLVIFLFVLKFIYVTYNQ